MHLIADFRLLIGALIKSKSKDNIKKDIRETIIENNPENESLKKILRKNIELDSDNFNGCHLFDQIDLTQNNYDKLSEILLELIDRQVIERTLNFSNPIYASNPLENTSDFVGYIKVYKFPKEQKMLRTIIDSKNLTKEIEYTEQLCYSKLQKEFNKRIYQIYKKFPLQEIENFLQENNYEEDYYLCLTLQDEYISLIILDQSNFQALVTSIIRNMRDLVNNIRAEYIPLEQWSNEIANMYNYIDNEYLSDLDKNFAIPKTYKTYTKDKNPKEVNIKKNMERIYDLLYTPNIKKSIINLETIYEYWAKVKEKK